MSIGLRKNYSPASLDEAIKGFRSNSGKIQARGRLSELSPEARKELKRNLKDSVLCPHEVTIAKDYTTQVTLLSVTLAPTVINLEGVHTKSTLYQQLDNF